MRNLLYCLIVLLLFSCKKDDEGFVTPVLHDNATYLLKNYWFANDPDAAEESFVHPNQKYTFIMRWDNDARVWSYYITDENGKPIFSLLSRRYIDIAKEQVVLSNGAVTISGTTKNDSD